MTASEPSNKSHNKTSETLRTSSAQKPKHYLSVKQWRSLFTEGLNFKYCSDDSSETSE